MTSAVPQKQFTGRHMLASIVAFFAVIIGVNLVMAYLANSTWSGLIVKNGYVASQSFGKDLAIAKSQEARGWTVVLSHDGNQVKLNFSDRISQKLSRLTVTGQLRRPTTDKLDQKLTFTPAGAGSYVAEAALRPGVWEVEIEAADAAGETYRKTYRFFVKG